jgi:hypothetical protein
VLEQIMGELGGIADGEGELDAGVFAGEGGEGGGDVVRRIRPDAKMACSAPAEQMLASASSRRAAGSGQSSRPSSSA